MPMLNSSNLASAEWSDGTLTITFKSGRTYRYFDVPEGIYDALLDAPSAGRYFNAFIKDSYQYE